MTDKIGQRLNRILLIVPFILSQEGAPIEKLCEEFRIDRDELVCDLDTLQMCGLPGYTGGDLIDYWIEGDRVYMILADYFKRPLNLTREEAVALFVAGRALIASDVFEEEGPLGSALSKVAHLLSEGEKAGIEELSERIDIQMSAYTGRWKEIIEEGFKNQKNLMIKYYSFSRDELTRREVEPISLVWSRGYWYLVAWCHEAGDYRLFRLDRIEAVEVTGKAGTVAEKRALEIPELVGEYKPGRKAHHVRLRFPGREGRRLVEEWPTASVFEEEDGTFLVELRTRNLSWLSNSLLRFGDRVCIESPKELKRMVEEKARELLKEYA